MHVGVGQDAASQDWMGMAHLGFNTELFAGDLCLEQNDNPLLYS